MAGREVDYTYYIYNSRYPWVADVRSLNDEVASGESDVRASPSLTAPDGVDGW